MSLNYEEINFLLKEIVLKDALIQSIIQPDYKTLVIEFFAKTKNNESHNLSLLISLDQKTSRFHLTKKRFKNIKPPLRFFQFLKSKLVGGVVIETKQIKNERIVVINIVKDNEPFNLCLKLWPTSPNIIVTDTELKIFDVYYRRPKSNEISGEIFVKLKEILEKLEDTKKTELSLKEEYNNETSYSEFLENYYEYFEGQINKEALKEKLKSEYEKELKNTKPRIENLEKQISLSLESEAVKEKGELILINLNTIEKGMKEIVLENFNGEKIKIILNTTLSPKENAEKYFKEYKKKKSSLEILKNQLELEKQKYEDLKEKLKDIEDDSFNSPKQKIEKKNKTLKVPQVGLHFVSEGFEIIVGRNAKENDELLRKYAKGNDYWLHTRDYPGAYVFIKNKKDKTPPLEVLLDAGNLCVFYTKPARKASKADLYYTKVKYLRRPKNGKIGLVIPTMEKNLSIKLDENTLNKFKNPK